MKFHNNDHAIIGKCSFDCTDEEVDFYHDSEYEPSNIEFIHCPPDEIYCIGKGNYKFNHP